MKEQYRLIIAALKGENFEYTSGSINRAIFLLSVPMIAEMVMESLFAVVDAYFVSKVSVNAIATVGLTESVLMIIYSIAVGLSMAITAIVARRVGEKRIKRASDAAFQAIAIAIVISALLGIAGYIFAEDVLRMMGGNPDLIEEGSGYTKIMYAGNISILLLFLNNGIFRGAGNASIAMRSLWIANILNMILDPILIFGLGPIPEMGVKGAAIATTTGRSLGVLYQWFHLFNGRAIVRLGIENLVIRLKTIKEIIKVSIGGVWQFLIESASWIFLVRIISNFGSEALAGYTIAFRVIIFTLLPSWGMANAAATLVGQNLGANQPDRAETSVWRIAKVNTYFLIIIAIVFFILSDPILTIFTNEQAVKNIGSTGLKIICFGYIFFAYGMVIGQAFNGSGDTRTPMYISLLVFWFIQIPLAYGLAMHTSWGLNGVFASIAIAHSLYALVAISLFRKGKWKKVVI